MNFLPLSSPEWHNPIMRVSVVRDRRDKGKETMRERTHS